MSAATVAGDPRASRYEALTFPQDLASRYRLLDVLATGAEGTLFLVERLSDREQLALKVYRKDIRADVRVVEALRSMGGQRVPLFHEHGDLIAGQYYEVTEYFPGGSLRQRLPSGNPLHVSTCRFLLQELSSALTAIHKPSETGLFIIHRDLKPENILGRRGSPLGLVLGDFGVALCSSGPSSVAHSACFTPAYAAPECFDGEFTTAVDYWSLGMILLEALRGSHPFAGMDTTLVTDKLRSTWEFDPAQVADERWRALLRGLLARNPGRPARLSEHNRRAAHVHKSQ